MSNLKQLSQRTVSPQEADSFIRTVLNEPELTEDNVQGSKMFQTVNSLYKVKAWDRNCHRLRVPHGVWLMP